MDLNKAIQAHAEWKTKLRAAIQTNTKLDSHAISIDNSCPLGKWLHGEAKAKYSGLKGYAECLGKHAAFHLEAGKVATAINAARYPEAEAMLAGGTPYSLASNEIGGAIIRLRKEARL